MTQFSISNDGYGEPCITWPEFIGTVSMSLAEARAEAAALLALIEQAETQAAERESRSQLLEACHQAIEHLGQNASDINAIEQARLVLEEAVGASAQEVQS